MLSLKELLTKMILTTTRETISLGTIAAQGYSASSKTITRAGYVPIGVIGFQVTSSYIFIPRVELSAASSGSGTISYEVRNTANGSATVSMNVDVLWRKA